MSETDRELLAAIEELVLQIAQAVSTRALYPAEHPHVVAATSGMAAATERFLDLTRQDAGTLLLIGNELVIDGRPLPRGAVHVQGFAQALGRLGVGGLTLRRGLDQAELRKFLDEVATGRTPTSTAHLEVGLIRTRVEDEPSAEAPDSRWTPADRGKAPRRLGLGTEVEAARAEFLALEKATGSSLRAIRRLIARALDELARSVPLLLPFAAPHDPAEALFQHSLRVALQALALGGAIGLKPAQLRDLGLAALLHDIGKLALPLDLLRRPGLLSEPEWQRMQTHAELGAARLCALVEAPALAALVAYEHHWRWDGRATFPVPRSPRPALLASRITAVADVYDALVHTHPGAAAAPGLPVELLRERAGGQLQPVLVEAFVRRLSGEPATGRPSPP
jgi:hypothetical protein